MELLGHHHKEHWDAETGQATQGGREMCVSVYMFVPLLLRRFQTIKLHERNAGLIARVLAKGIFCLKALLKLVLFILSSVFSNNKFKEHLLDYAFQYAINHIGYFNL